SVAVTVPVSCCFTISVTIGIAVRILLSVSFCFTINHSYIPPFSFLYSNLNMIFWGCQWISGDLENIFDNDYHFHLWYDYPSVLLFYGTAKSIISCFFHIFLLNTFNGAFYAKSRRLLPGVHRQRRTGPVACQPAALF